MLSNLDFRKKLGKGISIYPFESKNIESSNICVTASEYAWSVNTHRYLVVEKDGKKQICIPPKETAIIFTREAIYLDGKIAGTCHSRVDLTLRGLGHIGTPMKPDRAEILAIVISNQMDKEVYIEVKERIAVLMFHELSTKYRTEEKEESNINILHNFLSQCENPNEIIDKLKMLQKEYTGEIITLKMKSEPEYKKYKPSKNILSLLEKIRRNKVLNILGFLLCVQLGLMVKVGAIEPYLTWLPVTIPLTGVIFAAFLSKKIKG
jgi:deoxycytidine triphosphate deaminase